MRWILGVPVFVAPYALYTAAVNGAFLACPYRGKIGLWNFDSLAEPQTEYDDEDNPVSSTQLRRCRKCHGHVEVVWSDFEGREIRKAGS